MVIDEQEDHIEHDDQKAGDEREHIGRSRKHAPDAGQELFGRVLCHLHRPVTGQVSFDIIAFENLIQLFPYIFGQMLFGCLCQLGIGGHFGYGAAHVGQFIADYWDHEPDNERDSQCNGDQRKERG